MRVLPKDKTFILVKTPSGRTHVIEAHDNLAGKHQAMVVEGIVDAALGIFFEVKESRLSNLYIQLSREMEAAKGSLLSPVSFRPIAKDDKLDNINAVQIYKAFKGDYENIDENHDTTL